MKTIPMAKGYGEAMVDDEDYDQLVGFSWWLLSPKSCSTMYAARRTPRPEQKCVTMHAQIMGRKDGFEVDHIDGNGLNNQRANLRWATRSQNAANAVVRRDNKIGLKGVSFDKRLKIRPYRASVCCRGVRTHLGSFATAEEAHAAYREGARKYFGEFARVD